MSRLEKLSSEEQQSPSAQAEHPDIPSADLGVSQPGEEPLFTRPRGPRACRLLHVTNNQPFQIWMSARGGGPRHARYCVRMNGPPTSCYAQAVRIGGTDGASCSLLLPSACQAHVQRHAQLQEPLKALFPARSATSCWRGSSLRPSGRASMKPNKPDICLQAPFSNAVAHGILHN